VIGWGGTTAALWLGGTAFHLAGPDPVAWLPMLGFALVYATTVGRIMTSIRTTPVLRRNLLRREGDPLPPFVTPTPVPERAAPAQPVSIEAPVAESGMADVHAEA
jgi:hypothetical protein